MSDVVIELTKCLWRSAVLQVTITAGHKTFDSESFVHVSSCCNPILDSPALTNSLLVIVAI